MAENKELNMAGEGMLVLSLREIWEKVIFCVMRINCSTVYKDVIKLLLKVIYWCRQKLYFVYYLLLVDDLNGLYSNIY